MDPGMGVSEFYSGRSIFVTGGTGFMGKVLIWKLLTSCPDIRRVYVLIRPKRGQEPSLRLKETLQTTIFANLAEDSLAKAVAVEGDVTLPDLGLSVPDQQRLIDEVSVVFHLAATVKFDEDLTLSVSMNLKGTLSVMQLAKQIGPRLVAFIHVSTAYCHCYSNEKIEEKIYAIDADPVLIIDMCENQGGKNLNDPDVTKATLGLFPNTYTFTKALAENAVESFEGDLPVAIVRPSIVCATLSEPFPGWIDNLYGPTGIIAGSATGLLRTMLVNPDKLTDIIPVDVAINLIIAVGWKLGTGARVSTADDNCNDTTSKGSHNVAVYNCTSGAQAPLKWKQLRHFCVDPVRDNPMERMFWYPGGSFKSNKVFDRVCRVFQHYVPGCIYDVVLLASGNRPFVFKMFRKASKAMNALEYFSTREWHWSNEHVQELYVELSDKDKDTFNFSLREFKDWPLYFKNYVIGVRHFVLKNCPKTVESSKRKLRYFYALHLLFRFLMLAFICWVMLQLFHSFFPW